MQILKNEDKSATQAVLNVCQMMVDCLVENVLSLDENSGVYMHVYMCVTCTYVHEYNYTRTCFVRS